MKTDMDPVALGVFVFFFAMLYPFRRVNDPGSKIAAAAGALSDAARQRLARAEARRGPPESLDRNATEARFRALTAGEA